MWIKKWSDRKPKVQIKMQWQDKIYEIKYWQNATFTALTKCEMSIHEEKTEKLDWTEEPYLCRS